jgi:pyruvate-formate lyase-activating enzyme
MEDPTHYSFEQIKQRGEAINKVSTSFCLAKWTQSTILLYNGFTHSCHHPNRHKIIPLDLIENPQGLHNTPQKMRARDEMLKGIQTSECAYCWKIENLNKDFLSDRIYKSSHNWSFPRLDEVLRSGLGKDTVPSYLEIAFDSKCNSRCLYCNPESSSSWEQEIRRFGPIPNEDGPLYDLDYLKRIGALPIPQSEANPYIDAFWKWWPEIYKKLDVLRVTGGEPLMSPHTWRLLDLIESDARSDLSFSVNSNLCLPRPMIERLAKKINSIEPKIKAFDIYTSLESVGPQAEYVRSGMNYKEFYDNCIYLLDNTPTNVRLHFMTTINALSAPSFLNFLETIRDLRKKYLIKKNDFRVRMFFNILRWPPFLSLTMLPIHLKERYRETWVQFMEANVITNQSEETGPNEFFYPEEVEQVKRLSEFMMSTHSDKKAYLNFRLFIKAIDQRRNVDFVKTFPELKKFLDKDYYGG